MSDIYSKNTIKKETKVKINLELPQKVKSYKINILKNFKAYGAEVVKKRKEQQWLKENKEAIDKQNERIEKHGCFSDEHRRF